MLKFPSIPKQGIFLSSLLFDRYFASFVSTTVYKIIEFLFKEHSSIILFTWCSVLIKTNSFFSYSKLEKCDLSDKKIHVNINVLLNRVKIDKQNEKKYKIIFFSFGILLLIFMGLFVTIIR